MMKISFSIIVPAFIEKIFVWFLLQYRKLRYGYPFRKIKLTRGKYAIVDADNYDGLNKTRWYAVKAGETCYAVRSIYTGRAGAGTDKHKKRTTIKMHRQIMRPGEGLVVDHINHNGLDNRRANLRCVTQRQNSLNRRGRDGRTGIYWCKEHKRWRARICINGVKVHIGYYDSEAEARRACVLARGPDTASEHKSKIEWTGGVKNGIMAGI